MFFVVLLQTKTIAYERTFFFSLISSNFLNIEIPSLKLSPENLLHLLIWRINLVNLNCQVTVWRMTLEKIETKKVDFSLKVKVTNPFFISDLQCVLQRNLFAYLSRVKRHHWLRRTLCFLACPNWDFVSYNPCQSSPSVTIFVFLFHFILSYGVFLKQKYLFQSIR